jgi:type IV secretory pathway TrbL component
MGTIYSLFINVIRILSLEMILAMRRCLIIVLKPTYRSKTAAFQHGFFATSSLICINLLQIFAWFVTACYFVLTIYNHSMRY